MPKKMRLHLLHPHLHLPIPLLWYRRQNLLQVRYLFLRYEHRKRFPVKNPKQWRHEVIRYDHWNTFVHDRFDDSGAVHFVSFGTDAVFAVLHVP